MKKIEIPAEVYSRVSGYFRPVEQWNNGKKQEFIERKRLKFDNKITITPEIKLVNN